MKHLLPRTLGGTLVGTVVLFALVWQARSALLIAGIHVDSAVYLFTALAFTLFFALLFFMSVAEVEPGSRVRQSCDSRHPPGKS